MDELTTITCTVTGERLAAVNPERDAWNIDRDAIVRYGQAVADRLCEDQSLPKVIVEYTGDMHETMAYNFRQGETCRIRIGKNGADLALTGEPFEAVIAHELGHHRQAHAAQREHRMIVAVELAIVLIFMLAGALLGGHNLIGLMVGMLLTRRFQHQVRELLADRDAARWCGTRAMAEGLKLVHHDERNTRWRHWRLNLTHPPLALRLWCLSRTSFESGAPASVRIERPDGEVFDSLSIAAWPGPVPLKSGGQCADTNPMLQPLSIMDEIDPTLAEHIAQIMDECDFDLHPAGSFGQCNDWACMLVRRLRTRKRDEWADRMDAGLDDQTHLVSAETVHCQDWSQPRAENLGMTDRLNMGCVTHYWAVVHTQTHVWAIDLSAAQYGYSGPMVRWCEAGQEPDWAAPRARGEQVSLETLAANRRQAGVPEQLRDAAECDVWRDPRTGQWMVLIDPEESTRQWHRQWDGEESELAELWWPAHHVIAA